MSLEIFVSLAMGVFTAPVVGVYHNVELLAIYYLLRLCASASLYSGIDQVSIINSAENVRLAGFRVPLAGTIPTLLTAIWTCIEWRKTHSGVCCSEGRRQFALRLVWLSISWRALI